MPQTTEAPPATPDSAPTTTEEGTDAAAAENAESNDDLITEALADLDLVDVVLDPDPSTAADVTNDDQKDNNQAETANETDETTDEESDDETASDAEEEDENNDEDDEDEATDDESEEDEEEADDDEDADPASSEAVQKRIDKLTAQKSKFRDERDELQEKVTTLEEQVTEAQRTAVSLTPTAANPLANLTTDEQIAEKQRVTQAVYDWTMDPRNRDGATVGEGTDQERHYTAEEIAEKRQSAELELQLHIPKRREWIQQNKSHDRVARQVYPFLYEPGPESDKASEILNRAPGLLELPEHSLLIGDAMVGEACRMGLYKLVPVKANGKAEDKPKGEPKPKAKAKAASAPPSSAPSKTQPARQPAPPANAAATRRLTASGGSDLGALEELAGGLID